MRANLLVAQVALVLLVDVVGQRERDEGVPVARLHLRGILRRRGRLVRVGVGVRVGVRVWVRVRVWARVRVWVRVGAVVGRLVPQ